MNSNCSNLSYLRNLQEKVNKEFCYQKLFWPFTVWINCSSDLKHFANSWPSASNFKSLSRSVEQFFLTIGQNNFRNKIPLWWFKLRVESGWILKNIWTEIYLLSFRATGSFTSLSSSNLVDKFTLCDSDFSICTMRFWNGKK